MNPTDYGTWFKSLGRSSGQFFSVDDMRKELLTFEGGESWPLHMKRHTRYMSSQILIRSNTKRKYSFTLKRPKVIYTWEVKLFSIHGDSDSNLVYRGKTAVQAFNNFLIAYSIKHKG